MNKKNPIGIFDSGLGGLTVISEVIKALPDENIVYFGDTARVPYGSKSRDVVTRYSMQISSFLKKSKVKMIVVACNTASAFALGALKKNFSVPVVGVIEPGTKYASESTRNNRIGVIGTEGTIKSMSYQKSIIRRSRKFRVFGQACPLFVPIVEEGWMNKKVCYEIAEEYLKSLKNKNIDTLILGCTHYPLLEKVIVKTMGDKVRIVDSAVSTAREIKKILKSRNLLNGSGGAGELRYFVSDSPQKFKRAGQMFLGKNIAKVEKYNLED